MGQDRDYPIEADDRGQVGEFMSLYTEMEQVEDVAVVHCTGRIVRAEELSRLRDAVTSLSKIRFIVLDLSGVPMLDAAGLGMLVFLHNWTRANGIQLKLVDPSKLVREMLERTGLTSVLHISSVEDVVEMFCSSNRPIESVGRAVA